LGNIFHGDLLVKDLLRKDDDYRPPLTETVASRAHHIRLAGQTLFSDLFDKG